MIPPPLTDHLTCYLFLVADRRVSTGSVPSTPLNTTTAILCMVVRAWAVPGVAIDGLFDDLLLHLFI